MTPFEEGSRRTPGLAVVTVIAFVQSSSPSTFTRPEIDYCRARGKCYEHMAARFAAKEAVLKALGTGLVTGMRWTDVEVVNEEGGRPHVKLAGAVAAFAERLGVQQLEVSLSHTSGLALAQALALRTQD